MKLHEKFAFSYGSKLDLNKMNVLDSSDSDGINFIGRTAKNLGVVAKVKKLNDLEPYSSGLITVALGGSVLSSFVQQEPFYTAQNIMVLTPLEKMTIQEKIFFCMCIHKNAFRYTAYGREANRTLKELEIPNKAPDWVQKISMDESIALKPYHKKIIKLNDRKWMPFRYDSNYLFKIERGRGARKKDIIENGKTPFITSIDTNNGLTGFVDFPPIHSANVITVNRNGSVGEAFYQSKEFCSTEDVHIFNPNFKLNQFVAMFLITLIHKEKFRYSYGRKWGIERMNETIMMLPVNNNNEPDWQFMEDYIKSLPYSNNLQN